MRQSSAASPARAPAPVESPAARVSLIGRLPLIPIASTRMYCSASTSPGRRVISRPSGVNRIIVG